MASTCDDAAVIVLVRPIHANSITHGKAPADMLRLLHLVDHRHRIVLDRDATFSLTIRQQLIRPQSELAGALARKYVGRRREEGPFKARFIPKHVQSFPRRQRTLLWTGVAVVSLVALVALIVFMGRDNPPAANKHGYWTSEARPAHPACIRSGNRASRRTGPPA